MIEYQMRNCLSSISVDKKKRPGEILANLPGLARALDPAEYARCDQVCLYPSTGQGMMVDWTIVDL